MHDTTAMNSRKKTSEKQINKKLISRTGQISAGS